MSGLSSGDQNKSARLPIDTASASENGQELVEAAEGTSKIKLIICPHPTDDIQ